MRRDLMLVGEQPGDKEDLAGKPFVGPAGHVLDQALADAGIRARGDLRHQRGQALQVRDARQAPPAQAVRTPTRSSAASCGSSRSARSSSPRSSSRSAPPRRAACSGAPSRSPRSAAQRIDLDDGTRRVRHHPSLVLLRIEDEADKEREYRRIRRRPENRGQARAAIGGLTPIPLRRIVRDERFASASITSAACGPLASTVIDVPVAGGQHHQAHDRVAADGLAAARTHTSASNARPSARTWPRRARAGPSC